MSNDTFITSPVGRVVWGSVATPKTKDSTGKPLVVKTGPDAGKPAPRYEFGLAVEKKGTTHWNQLGEFGKKIYDAGVAAFPNRQYERPDFSWKVTDGDSTIPNKRGVAPCTRQGHPGCWVFAFSSSFAPEVLDATGKNRIDPSQIKTGYFIQVAGSVKGNNNLESPGVYLNSRFVSLQAYGPEIVHGPDPSSLGFGTAPMPAGASATPTGNFVPPVQGAPVVPAPVVVQPPAPVVAAPVVAPPAPPAPVVVTPRPEILSPPVRQMTPKANGASFEQFVAAGWTEALLRTEGYLV